MRRLLFWTEHGLPHFTLSMQSTKPSPVAPWRVMRVDAKPGMKLPSPGAAACEGKNMTADLILTHATATAAVQPPSKQS